MPNSHDLAMKHFATVWLPDACMKVLDDNYTTTIRQLYDNLYDNSKKYIFPWESVYSHMRAISQGRRFLESNTEFLHMCTKPMGNAVVVQVVV